MLDQKLHKVSFNAVSFGPYLFDITQLDLDALAGAIAYKHIDNGDPEAPPVTVVTASVDRLDLFLPEAGIENYKLSGHVTYVGSSSMESK